jgi:hypothetical protein
MIYFEGLRDLLSLLKVKHTPKTHWSESLGWGIIELMNPPAMLSMSLIFCL